MRPSTVGPRPLCEAKSFCASPEPVSGLYAPPTVTMSFAVAGVRRGSDARVIAREGRRDRGPMSEGAIGERGQVVAVLDRPRIPGTSSARPGELPGEDAHVEVPDDLAAGQVRGVVEVSRDDRSGRLPERRAVVIEAGVRLADDLAGGIQPNVPIAVVRRGIRLDHPIGFRVPDR